MTGEQALRLARYGDAAESLLGVTALGLLGDASALPHLDRLASQPGVDPTLAGAAALSVRRIGAAGLLAGVERLTTRRTRRPSHDPVVGLLRPVSVRRQVLRTFLAEPPDDRARVLEVVRAGLVDEDWEVRWTALLAAHDCDLHETLPEIRRCTAPADRDLRPLLDGLRDVVGHRLAGTGAAFPGAAHIEAVLDGTTGIGDRDALFLLVASLRDPLPDADEPKGAPVFCRVSVVPHWLGTAGTGIRRVTPTVPLEVAVTARPDVPRQQVDSALRELSHDCGRALRLPTPDELEMASRGPDGRRFPWGNAREPGWRRACSPWGLVAPLRTAEWVDADGVLVALPPARRGCGSAAAPAEVAAVRGVLA